MSKDLFSEAILQFRVTIGAEDSPALFAALWSIKAPRRRVSRFRDLAIKGLLLEQFGAHAVGLNAGGRQAGAGGPVSSSNNTKTSSMSVSEQLSWGDDGA
ncbi:MAG: hypothetical protein ABI580_13585 [Burkholderiaceae bacterium]